MYPRHKDVLEQLRRQRAVISTACDHQQTCTELMVRRSSWSKVLPALIRLFFLSLSWYGRGVSASEAASMTLPLALSEHPLLVSLVLLRLVRAISKDPSLTSHKTRPRIFSSILLPTSSKFSHERVCSASQALDRPRRVPQVINRRTLMGVDCGTKYVLYLSTAIFPFCEDICLSPRHMDFEKSIGGYLISPM